MKTFRLGLEWFLNPDHLPFLIGLEKGWFRDAGLDLELVEPATHLDALAEITAGRMDAAITEPIHLLEDAAKGQSVMGFARFLHTNGGVMYLRQKGIERPRDMAGKRLQYPGAPGPGGPAIVATMVEADGGTCDPAALVPVNSGFHHTDALAEDKADLATLVFYNFELIEARHRGLDADFFALKDWGVPDFCQLILITTPENLERDRPTYQQLVTILRRGIDLIKQDPAEAAAIWFKRTGTNPEDALNRKILDATAACFTHDFSLSASYYRRLGDWMLERGLIPAPVHPGDVWTDELAF
jgi:putative hydroxymethylpyrimidine transport system substrate-binding protein